MSHHIISLLFRFHSLLILSELFLFRTPPIAAIPFHFVSCPNPSPQRLSLSHHFTSQLILFKPRLSLLCRVVSCPFRTLLFQFISIHLVSLHLLTMPFPFTSAQSPTVRHFSISKPFFSPHLETLLLQFVSIRNVSILLHWISFIGNIFPCKTSFAAIVPLSNAV